MHEVYCALPNFYLAEVTKENTQNKHSKKYVISTITV